MTRGDLNVSPPRLDEARGGGRLAARAEESAKAPSMPTPMRMTSPIAAAN